MYTIKKITNNANQLILFPGRYNEALLKKTELSLKEKTSIGKNLKILYCRSHIILLNIPRTTEQSVLLMLPFSDFSSAFSFKKMRKVTQSHNKC